MPAAKSDAFVFFGATGDLAYKQIFPALQALVKDGKLDMPVIGIARSGWNVEQLRRRARDSLAEHGGVDKAAFAQAIGDSFKTFGFAMGFGFVVERFGLFLRMISNQPLSDAQRGFSLWLGVVLLMLGAGVAVASALQFRRVLRGLGEKEIPAGYWTTLGIWLNFILAAVALALTVYFVISA